jgi:hypothetical protein
MTKRRGKVRKRDNLSTYFVGTLGTLCTGLESRHGVGYATTSCYVSLSTGPHLPAGEGSDAAMCPTASDFASLLRRALTPPYVSRLQTPPPRWGGLRRRHMSHDSLRHVASCIFLSVDQSYEHLIKRKTETVSRTWTMSGWLSRVEKY